MAVLRNLTAQTAQFCKTKVIGDSLMNKFLITLPILLLVSTLTACSPEVGSEAWCEDLAEKPKGDWSSNEAAEFAKSCVFKSYNDE